MRADLYIFNSGYAKSRSAAKALIEASAVILDGKALLKPAEEVDEAVAHTVVITQAEKFVGRGGLKLEAALDNFSVDVSKLDCLDIGASTGGFTDCLIQRGATAVIAIDSGERQLDPKLASDPRVTNIERYNARELSRDIAPDGVDLVVMDVSFISQTLILPRIPSILRPGGIVITLIKPQFEAGRSAVGKGGIVKNKRDRLMSVIRVRDAATLVGLGMTDIMLSPITGGDGNIEFLAKFETQKVPLNDTSVKKKIGF